VNRKLRAAVLALPAIVILAAAIAGGLWYRARAATPATLLRRLPATDAVLIYVDFESLRRAGILDQLENPKAVEEPEYRDFVRRIDFDYKRDLDTAALAIAPSGKYLLVRGRFNWKKLDAYVESQNGRCEHSFCRMQGSTPDRRISFFPTESDLMALAVSSDDSAALRLSTAAASPDIPAPDAPLWISIPPSVLQSGDTLPPETRTFAHSVAGADSVLLSFAPDQGRFAARLAIRCRTAQDAAELAAQLTRLTTLLRQTFSAQHQTPNPADLTGVLAAGAFRPDSTRVVGYWPIDHAFVTNLLGE
jgi:hypothetical protein